MSKSNKFESLSMEQLEAYKLDLKNQIDGLRQDAREANTVYAQRVEEFHFEEATRQVELAAKENGIKPEQQAFRWIASNEPDPGHRILAMRYLKASGNPDFANAPNNPHRPSAADAARAEEQENT